MFTRPNSDEFAAFYAGYVQRVPEGADLIALLASQPSELRALLANLTEARAEERPAPGEWSVKEVLGHIVDTERVFAYRALRVGRGDRTPLPGFDQDEFVNAADFNARSLADLLDEFDLQRRANVLLAKSLSADEIDRRGTASTHHVSVRALFFIIAGHVMHHIESLTTDYNVAG